MKEKELYWIWAGLYILCAGLGFIQEPDTGGKVVLVILALIFFVPGIMLLRLGARTRSVKLICRIRNLAAVSLGATLLMLIANFLSVFTSKPVGNILHVLLALVSAPMLCGQFWVISLFCWACLLMTGISLGKKAKRATK